MPSDNVREVQQARASSTTLATLTGKAGQLIVNKSDWRGHVMDGATAGGHEVALLADLTSFQTAILEAIEDVIEDHGGTVPTV